MTPHELRNKVKTTGSLFFSRDTMNFFGDSMGNYGIRAKTETILTASGETKTCWVLYRRHPVKHGLQDDAFFDINTFERVHPRRTS